MSAGDSRKNAAGTRGKPFANGNPGRPKGARNKTTVAVESLLEGEAEALTRRAVQAALAGDVSALRLCLDRVAPSRKDRLVHLDLPPMRRATDVPSALAAVIADVAAGQVTPAEGLAVAALLDRFRAADQATAGEAASAIMDDLLFQKI